MLQVHARRDLADPYDDLTHCSNYRYRRCLLDWLREPGDDGDEHFRRTDEWFELNYPDHPYDVR